VPTSKEKLELERRTVRLTIVDDTDEMVTQVQLRVPYRIERLELVEGVVPGTGMLRVLRKEGA
jgi:hypothetical protein